MNHRALLLALSVVCASTGDVAQEFLTSCNQVRQQQGLPPLCLNQDLMSAAAKRAQVLTDAGNLLSHTYMNDVATRAANAGYQWNAIAENLASAGDPSSAFSQLYNEQPPNDGHRQNILNPQFQHMGVGQDGNGVIVQMFGASSSGSCMQPAPANQTAAIPATSSQNATSTPASQPTPVVYDLKVQPVTTIASTPVLSSVGIKKCKVRPTPTPSSLPPKKCRMRPATAAVLSSAYATPIAPSTADSFEASTKVVSSSTPCILYKSMSSTEVPSPPPDHAQQIPSVSTIPCQSSSVAASPTPDQAVQQPSSTPSSGSNETPSGTPCTETKMVSETPSPDQAIQYPISTPSSDSSPSSVSTSSPCSETKSIPVMPTPENAKQQTSTTPCPESSSMVMAPTPDNAVQSPSVTSQATSTSISTPSESSSAEASVPITSPEATPCTKK